MDKRIQVLMIEDSSSLSLIYKAYLEDSPYQVQSVDSLETAYSALANSQPDIILLDIELPDGSGMDLLSSLETKENAPAVIVMTAHGTSDMAVEAIHRGAFDFLTKPFDAARLNVTLDNAAAQLQLGERARELADLEREQYCGFIGSSLAMQSVYKTIDSVAASDATVFIVGESGTGKELAAEAIHQQSPRAEAPFIAINCGAIPPELMESELFGHVKGAFTGASSNRQGAASTANGGTLFLDEICEMSLELQKKLLRFIQEGTFRKVGSDSEEKVDLRFVCATNRDPLVQVREGLFREDLFYRLHVVPVRMPSLRERGEDILSIANNFLQQYSKQEDKQFTAFSDQTQETLLRYPWPGNVRQLQNTVHQVVVLNDGPLVDPSMLPVTITSGALEPTAADTSPSSGMAADVLPLVPDPQKSHKQRREQIEPLWLTEKKAVEVAIETCGGNINLAAGLLEVAPSTIYRKVQTWKKLQA